MHKEAQAKNIEFNDDGTFWLSTHKDGKLIKIRLDLRIFPKERALKQAVGDARSEPNQEPFLPPPVGRLQFTLNPFAMIVSKV